MAENLSHFVWNPDVVLAVVLQVRTIIYYILYIVCLVFFG